MKIKLIGENDIYNPIEQVLKNRGITYEELNPTEEVVEDYMNYDNMQEGVELLLKHIDNKSKICVLEDSDVDGVTSAGMLIDYLRSEFDANIVYRFHQGKEHGLSDNRFIVDDDIDLIIVPDAGTNDVQEIKELYDRGIEVLVIDHHEREVISPHGVIINNQTSDKVKNKNLSGVGVVYHFLRALSDYAYTKNPDEYLDLVALGNIADVMNMKEAETRYLTKRGLSQINNMFFKSLIKEKEYDLDGKINIKSIGWTISPLINGMIRSGTLAEKRELYSTTFSNNLELCEKVAKMCKNAKQRQDSAVKSAMKKIENSISITNEDRVIIADSLGANKSFTGLIAGKLVSKYKLPCILYSKNDGVASGSIRGIGDINFKEDLIKSDLINYCQGHSNAAGIELDSNNIELLKQYINNLYKEVKFEDSKVYEVDFELESYELNQAFVDEVTSLEDEWGNGLDEPLVAIKNVDLFLTQDNIKGRLNVVFDINSVKLIKKFTSNAWKEEFLNRDLFVDIVGRFSFDNYINKGVIEIVDIIKI